jgi:hypothetical protein
MLSILTILSRVSRTLIPIVGLISFSLLASAQTRSYSTKFPLTENPISEGGNWLNGMTNGLDWSDAATVTGNAYGILQSASYADTVATVAGTWGADQTVTEVASVTAINTQEEIAVRVHTTITAHNISGYEIGFRTCATPCTDTSAYLIVVRWNGPYGNFTYIGGSPLFGSQYGVQNGDTLMVTTVGSQISVYKNGVLLTQVNDSTFPTGAPGFGLDAAGGNYQGVFGISSFTASSGSSGSSGGTGSTGSAGTCDLNQDGVVNVVDVQLAVNMDLGVLSCPTGLDGGVCGPTLVQQVLTAALGEGCAATMGSSGPINPSVSLNWTASTSANIAGYNVYRSSTSGGPYTQLNSSLVTTTSFTDSTVAAGQTYYYVTTTVDTSNDQSAYSNQAQVTIPSS